MYIDYFSFFLLLFFTAFSIYIVVQKREFVREHRNVILFLFVGVLLYSQYTRYFARLFTINSEYTIRDVPLGYCRLSAISITLYVITKNKYIGQFLYYQAGFGIFSILFPGGNFFILLEGQRNIGYIFDHYMITMMTVFLIYIERLKPTKKFMYGMMIYGIVVPLALLPYSISTGDNAFYNLDGAFIPMVFGNNQVVISIVYVIGVTTYFYIMYVLSKVMIKHSETPQIKPLFKPLWPWVSLGVFFIVGLTVGKYFINIVPKDVRNLADQYESEPVRIMEKFGNIYEGEIDGEKVFFIYLIDKFEEVEVMDYEGNILDVQEEGDVFYYNQDDADGKVIIILYKNRGEENEMVRTYNFNN